MGSLEQQDVPDYLCGEQQWETPENTQLYLAASQGDCAKLRDALEKGANPNYAAKHDDQAFTLHAAARSPAAKGRSSGAALCAKELIGKGARVSAALISNRNEPIHEAANAGAKDVCQVLIEASPKCAESVNSFGNTAMHTSTRAGSPDVVKLLLEKGADPNIQNHRGSTALHIACFLASNEKEAPIDDDDIDPHLKIAAMLLCNYRVEVDVCDVNGYTPLHIAAQRGCTELVKVLVDSGASLTAKTGIDSKGRGARTPAGMAKFGGKESTLKILEDAMAADPADIVTKTLARKLVPDCWKY